MKANRSTATIVILSVVGLAGLFWLTLQAAQATGVSLGLHGWAAIVLGSVLSLVVSVVLFGLTFYSARSGHDDKIDPRD